MYLDQKTMIGWRYKLFRDEESLRYLKALF